MDNGITIDEVTSGKLSHLRELGKVSVIIADTDGCIGIMALSDALRPEVAETVSKLHNMNTKTVLLTGDNHKTANYFALQFGISEVRAELLPEEKVSSIEKLKNEGRVVCMIGDGVNDAPALKLADVGSAMGGMGSDIALEAADIALVGDDISKIPY